jgi:hypothetical protein
MRNKTLQELTLQELASIHLDTYGNPQTLADGHIQSGMGYLITEIQQSLPRVYTGFFSPLYGAFALLDQIGEIYTNSEKEVCSNSYASGIKKALYYFADMELDSGEMLALYGLRNSLMHDGSLLFRGRFNEQQSRWTGPFHKYQWNKELGVAVALPDIPWDGNLNSIGVENTTMINVREICNLAIQSVQAARDVMNRGHLGISLHDGEIELYYRYLFHQTD